MIPILLDAGVHINAETVGALYLVEHPAAIMSKLIGTSTPPPSVETAERFSYQWPIKTNMQDFHSWLIFIGASTPAHHSIVIVVSHPGDGPVEFTVPG